MPRLRPLTMPMRRAWAQVRILLNLGQMEAATRAALEASAITQWRERLPSMSSGYPIFLSDELPIGWCWVEPQQYRTLLSRTAMREHGHGSAPFVFCHAVVAAGGPSRFARYDPHTWALMNGMDELLYQRDVVDGFPEALN